MPLGGESDPFGGGVSSAARRRSFGNLAAAGAAGFFKLARVRRWLSAVVGVLWCVVCWLSLSVQV
jgi:hypothetical protein